MDTMVSRRTLASLVGVLSLGAAGIPVQAADDLPACTMRIHLRFEQPSRRSIALTAQVVQTAAGWQLQGLFSPITKEVVTVSLDPSGEFAQLLVTALRSEEPDPELALVTRLGDWQGTINRRMV